MKQFLRTGMTWLIRDYRINWIYATDVVSQALPGPGDSIVPADDALHAMLAVSTTEKMRNSLSYARGGLDGLALIRDGKPLCIAHFTGRGNYDRDDTWPLREDEVALMDIATQDEARGQGLAPLVMAAATRHYLTMPGRRMIAFIWWSNTPSLRAFAKAGWRRIGLGLEWEMAGRWWSIRLPM